MGARGRPPGPPAGPRRSHHRLPLIIALPALVTGAGALEVRCGERFARELPPRLRRLPTGFATGVLDDDGTPLLGAVLEAWLGSRRAGAAVTWHRG